MTSAAWLAHYDPGVPFSLAPYPNRTLIDYLADSARTRPDRPALLFKGTTITWGALDRLSDACAAGLASIGVRRGERVALVLPNCPQFLIVELGAWKIGAIVAPLNPLYTDRELEGPIAEHGVETVVTLTRFYRRVKQVQAKTGVRRVIATNIKEHFPRLLRFLFTIARERREGDRVDLAPRDYDLAALLRRHRGAAPPCEAPAPDEAAVLLLSGGTTGTPKGVLGTHGAYVISALQLRAWTASIIDNPEEVFFLPLPLFHVYANAGVQALALVNGNPLALVPNPRDLSDLVATLRRVKPAFFNGVPTLYIALLNHPDVRRGAVDFRSMKLCASGAAPLLAETKHRFESLTGSRIIEGYSLTEAMMATCMNPLQGPNKVGSVGMPLPDVQVRIFDADEGTRELAANEVGEIAISAPQLMAGFWHRPDETAHVLRDHVDASGTRRWLHTGDLGYVDEDGYVFIVDRKKDLIKTSGFQVWPREIEEVLATHPSVAEVGAAGVPDPVKGEVAKAWVVLRAGQTATEQDLRAFCRERLAPHKVPAAIEFRTVLPKTLVGKVLRRALRDA